jgi:hypothetical protein
MSTYLVELVSLIIWLNLYVGLFLSCWYLHVRIIILDYFEFVCGIILLLHASMKCAHVNQGQIGQTRLTKRNFGSQSESAILAEHPQQTTPAPLGASSSWISGVELL